MILTISAVTNNSSIQSSTNYIVLEVIKIPIEELGKGGHKVVPDYLI